MGQYWSGKTGSRFGGLPALASILKKLGIRNGFLNSYHQSFEESPRYQEYLEMLEYDMLYGEQAVYGGTSGYEPTDMQMGVVPITLSQCYLLGDTFYVLGDCLPRTAGFVSMEIR